MSSICDICPLDDLMVDIPNTTCPENIKQIQRYIFARKSAGIIWDLVDPALNLPASIVGNVVEVNTGWNVLVAAADLTHIVRTPLIGGSSGITPGATRTEGGGDNTTLNGKKLNNGKDPADAVASFRSLTGDQIAAFEKLECIAEAGDLEVYLINQSDKLIGRKNGNKFTGFSVEYFEFGGLTNTGLDNKDVNVMAFQLKAEWAQYKHFVTPTFSMLNPAIF
jgi:hypothetical protein